MANLAKSTHQADAVVHQCSCESTCVPTCPQAGRWHSHADDACPRHPERLVDALT